MSDEFGANLEHMARPATPSQREDAVSTTLSDVQSLYLATILREWSGYHAEPEQQSIATGYAEYIDNQVRENGESMVTIYAHTQAAAETLNDAVHDYEHFYPEQTYDGLHRELDECLIDLWGRQHAEQVNTDAGREVYDKPPSVSQLEFAE